MIDSNGDVAQKILDGWQPRLGLVWQPGGREGQKVSASYGRFYHDLATLVTANEYTDEQWYNQTTYDHDPRNDPNAQNDLWPWTPLTEVNGLRGQYYDEVTLGYERRMFSAAKFTARGIYRTLGRALQTGTSESGALVFGNPGYGIMSAYPKATREYTALEIMWRQDMKDRASLLCSYRLSRNYGNYTGLFSSDWEWKGPNDNGTWGAPDLMVNSTGLLPNDRTHVLKLAGSYRFGRGLTLGLIGSVMSGTPLNEFGGSVYGPPYYTFMRKRGTAGHMPWIWDLSLRTSYTLPFRGAGRVQPRLTFDLMHIASQREPVDFDQVRYLTLDENGNQASPSPTYLMPTRYQPPMAMRMGVEVAF